MKVGISKGKILGFVETRDVFNGRCTVHINFENFL